MPFAPLKFADYMLRLTARIVSRSRLTDLAPGGEVHTITSAVSRELDATSWQDVQLQRIWDLDTAQDDDLDARIEDLPLDDFERRKVKVPASGAVTFARAAAGPVVAIPAGHRVRVPSGGPEYATTAAVNLVGLTVNANVVAVEGGDASNTDAGTITGLDAVSGVETVTNAAALTNGLDRETNAQLRDRAKAYLRSLARVTVEAVRGAVLGVTTSAGSINTATVIENPGGALCEAIVYVDDGAGTAATSTTSTNEVVIASAGGGESRFAALNWAIIPGMAFDLEINAVAQTEGVDYTLDRSTGKIILDSGVYPTGLAALDTVEIMTYTHYTGLIREAQKVVNGDPGDRVAYPGYRPAGTKVSVWPPTILMQTITALLSVDAGYVQADVAALVEAAINRYVNGLGIGDHIIWTELVYLAQTIPGVHDIQFLAPTSNVPISPSELARTRASLISVS